MKTFFTKSAYAALVCLFVCACNKHSDLNTENEVCYSETVSFLTDYNASLIEEAKNEQTRCSGCEFCTYLTADGIGAFDLGSIGFKVGGFLGPKGAVAGVIIGGLVGAVGASYAVYDQFNGASRTSGNVGAEEVLHEVEQAYVLFMQSGGMDRIIESNDLDINIAYDESQLTGLIHNEVLDILITKKHLITSIDTDAYFSPEERAVLDSQQYIDGFSKFMEYDASKIIALYENGVYDQISKLYFDLISTYPVNNNEVKKISNVYAKATVDCDDLSEEEKKILISAYSTAINSGKYWENKLK